MAPPSKSIIERAPTGIVGLDKLLCGGMPKGSTVLVSGSPGAGKSILCAQTIINACRNGEQCLYICVEDDKEGLIKQAKALGWPIEECLNSGTLHLLSFDILKDRDVIDGIFKTIKQYKISRVVVDSMTALEHNPSFLFEIERLDVLITQKRTQFIRHEEWLTRIAIYNFIRQLRSSGVTSIIISEITEDNTRLSSDGVSEFLCDGIILLNYLRTGAEESRVIEVRKMRYTDHVKGPHIFNIDNAKGVRVEQEAGTKFSIRA